MNEKFIALYLRISKSDCDDGSVKDESASINSQRTLINDFLDNHTELSEYPRFEAVDDGFSGTNADRPMLQKILTMAESGQLTAIVVKDTSRFFRNYTQMGLHMDIHFPNWDVRFLSITDGYDSNNYLGTTSSFEQGFKNIIYSSYPQTLSASVKSARLQLANEGKFMGSKPPYGYLINPQDRYSLIVDEVAAKVVKMIFDLAISGKSTKEISNTLNSENVTSAYKHYCMTNGKKFTYNRTVLSDEWSVGYVRKILKNPVYRGAMVNNRSTRVEVGKKTQKKSLPIIVENRHEPIVTLEEFEKAKCIFRKSSSRTNKVNTSYPLRSLIRCGTCKRVIPRYMTDARGGTFPCPYCSVKKESYYSKTDFLTEIELEEYIYKEIAQKVQQIEEYTEIQGCEVDGKPDHVSVGHEIHKHKAQITLLKQEKVVAYETFKFGEGDRQRYLNQKSALDLEIEECKNSITLLNSIQLKEELAPQGNKILKELVLEYKQSTKLTYELAQLFCRSVYIYADKTIEIEFKDTE